MAKPKVLLVDDSIDTLNLVLMGVEAYAPPFEIKTALTASKAAEMLNQETFDAVILDVALPDITGAMLGELIRKSKPNLPIAFLTNYNGPQTVQSAEDIGAHFWYKPNVLNNFDKLTECINNLVKGKGCGSTLPEYTINVRENSIVHEFQIPKIVGEIGNGS